ncbi:DUF397 domain-containing protein [Streptomyces exfoliatus]|uniref:DUF397 domain-containing protein n=1 Tax=Streptomyces exfoliatus TaxID=1905 RepID=UPI003C2E8F83
MKSMTSKKPPRLHWAKSSYSNGSGGECLEFAQAEAEIFIRDSKSIQRSTISIRTASWQVFIDSPLARQRAT